MSVVRRFLVAPALVRLIRKERGGSRITEGYFAPQGGRISFVRVDGQHCHLVLVDMNADGVSNEERTDVPRAHGDALLDVCSGKAAYDRTTVPLGGSREAVIDRYVNPGALDLISVAFDEQDGAKAFAPPAWFGGEVSADAAYERHAIALQGPPQPGEIPLDNAALDAVLDLIEPRFGFGRYGASGSSAKPGEDSGAGTALRRGTGTGTAAPAAAAAAAVAASPTPEAEAPAHDGEPAPAEAAAPERHSEESEAAAQPQAEDTDDSSQGDTRIDDVIESLSQALGAAIHQPPQDQPSQEDMPAPAFERWTVRPRRTQQT